PLWSDEDTTLQCRGYPLAPSPAYLLPPFDNTAAHHRKSSVAKHSSPPNSLFLIWRRTPPRRYNFFVPHKIAIFGIWRRLVARVVRDDEVAGSNPVIPTKFFPSAFSLAFLG